jgi:hypothetical protein
VVAGGVVIEKADGRTYCSSIHYRFDPIFLITNFAVWYGSTHYPQTMPGLITCYVAGLAFYNGTSFFLNGLAGDLFYSTILFGGYYLLQLRFGELKPIRLRRF